MECLQPRQPRHFQNMDKHRATQPHRLGYLIVGQQRRSLRGGLLGRLLDRLLGRFG